MFITNLNSHCVKRVLTFLTKQEILKFMECFPEYQDVSDLYWQMQRAISFEKTTPNERLTILGKMSLCLNLTELKFTRFEIVENTKFILHAIGRHLPALEVLDLGLSIELTAERAVFLKFCHKLKSLTALIPIHDMNYPLSGLFSRRTQLEHLSITGSPRSFAQRDDLCGDLAFFHLNGHIDRDALETRRNLSRQYTIKNFRTSFLRSVIETQTSLKSFKIDYGDDFILIELFFNNNQLEDVTLSGYAITGECLEFVPNDVRCLDIGHCPFIRSEELFVLLDNSTPESLTLYTRNRIPYLLQDVVNMVPTLEHLALYCDDYYTQSLLVLERLPLLRSLRLFNIAIGHKRELQRIADSCGHLELLEITGNELGVSEDLFTSIAELPILTELSIGSHCDKSTTKYTDLMRCLSTSRSLTSVRFGYCSSFRNEAALTLIRGSNVLTNLEVEGWHFTAQLVTEIKEVLTQQGNRTNVLHVTFKDVLFTAKDIPKESYHRLLRVNIIG